MYIFKLQQWYDAFLLFDFYLQQVVLIQNLNLNNEK